MAKTLLAIIADDLTGALDAAAPFSRIAGGVLAATGPEALGPALAAAPAVLAVSTRSREVPAGTARERVAQVLAALPAGTRVVKKIDSRLKGNIAAELEPFAPQPLVVLPAIPEFGRIVRGGHLSGFGVAAPIPVRAALGRRAGMALVPDTVTQADMRAAVAKAPTDALLVGARGMTQALAETLEVQPPPGPPLERPICFVVGSTDPITIAQVDRLRAAVSALHHVQAPAGRVPPRRGAAAAVTLVQATGGEAAAPEEVGACLAAGAVPYLQGVRSMVLTGGATAEAVLDRLGVSILTVAGEALSGVVLCHAGGQAIVTKSGGFGAPDGFVLLAGAANAEV